MVDYLHAAALCSVHLSRLAEEIILWASQPFGFVRLPDAWSTGSSIMPNKRNPDAAELVRGHSARIVGDLVALLVLLKGLPLAYAKDLQDDKPPLFDAHDLLTLSLAAMAGMIADLEFVPDRCAPPRRPAMPPRPTSPTGWRAKACRSARRTTSPAARSPRPKAQGKALDELSLAELQAVDPRIGEAALAAAVGRSLGRVANLGWRDRAGAGSRSDRGGARRPPESMMKLVRLVPFALILAGCGSVAPLQPAAGPVAAGQAGDGAGHPDRRAIADPAALCPARADRRIDEALDAAPGRPLRPAAARRRRRALARDRGTELVRRNPAVSPPK